MDEQTLPFEEEAIDLHETNAACATEGVDDEWPVFAWPRSRAVGAALGFAFVLMAFGSWAQSPAGSDAPEPESRRARRAAEERAEQAAVEAPELDRRRDRRSGRRGADGQAETAPVPAAAAAGHERALAAMRAENWSEAALELEVLTLEYPAYPGAHVNLALVYRKVGRRDEARAEIERALALDPGHPAANTELGILLREDGKLAEAEQAYRRALETDPNYGLAHYNLGVLLDIYLLEPAEALEHYERYQGSLAEPNETVGRWIMDLRRRVAEEARVTQ